MKIQKREWFVIFSLIVLFAGINLYQHYEILREGFVSAATVGIPNPGHSLSELECSADSLCIDTANNRIGIGTSNPTVKLDVNGVINLNANKITNVAAPTSSTDAANKEYVDASSGGGGTYSTCYVINSSAAKSCASGYTTVARNNSTGGWAFGGDLAGGNVAAFVTVGGQMLNLNFSSTRMKLGGSSTAEAYDYHLNDDLDGWIGSSTSGLTNCNVTQSGQLVMTLNGTSYTSNTVINKVYGWPTTDCSSQAWTLWRSDVAAIYTNATIALCCK